MRSSASYMRTACYYGRENFRREILDDKAFWYGIMQKSTFRLVAIAVRSDCQRQGLGTRMLDTIMEMCRENGIGKITLRTHQGGRAQSFWLRHGAQITEQKGEDVEMSVKVKGVKESAAISKTYNSPRWTNEIADCSLPMTFDTYSNCSFGCVYCFSQYQRGLGKSKDAYLNKEVRSVDPEKIRQLFTMEKRNQFTPWIAARRPIQWGGLSDQFDGFERKYGVTLEILRMLRKMNYPICFSTKSAWVFHDERYTSLFEGADNWNMKFSIITLDEAMARHIEQGVPSPQARLEAMKIYSQLNKGGATLRLRPFIIGVTSKDYKDLIVAAHDSGATAVTTEFFCMETRSVVARKNYEIISECAGFDIVDFYKRYSSGSGYLRLNRKIKEKYIREMDTLCQKLGMRFYVSDAHFKETCVGSCCCGLPEDPRFNYSRGNFSYALQLCRRNGKVTFAEIDADMRHLDFPWAKAEGYNTNSVERRAKFEYMTMRDYLRYLWNNPYAGQSPYTLFGGVMRPSGKDENGDIIYTFDGTKTYISPCQTCHLSGC